MTKEFYDLKPIELFHLGPPATISTNCGYSSMDGSRLVFAGGFPTFQVGDLVAIKRVIIQSFPYFTDDELEESAAEVSKELKRRGLELMASRRRRKGNSWGGLRATR